MKTKTDFKTQNIKVQILLGQARFRQKVIFEKAYNHIKRFCHMPIEKAELQEISPSTPIMESLEQGKFYSKDEIAEKLFGHTLSGENDILNYLPEEYRDKKTVPPETMMLAIAFLAKDIAILESYLMLHLTSGDLIEGSKDGMPYYGKPT